MDNAAQFSKLDEKRQAFILISALKEGERAIQLLSFLPESKARPLKEPLEELAKITKDQRDAEIVKALQGLLPKNQESLLDRADVGWIIESFQQEPLRTLSLLLKELPKATVVQVLSELPRETRKVLKTFKPQEILPEVLEVVHRRFRAQFPHISKNQSESQDPFVRLSSLSEKQLNQLLREVGLHEMSMAFRDINRSATRAILYRLSISDAKELRQRIKKSPNYSLEQQREAQLNLLSMDIDQSQAPELAREIGFFLFSKAFSKADLWLAALFIYQLPPRQGYLLKRYIDLNAVKNAPDQAAKMKERILDAFMRLYEK